MASLTTVTLGGYNVYDPPGDYNLPINYFEFHGGGSCYGYGVFCMTDADFNEMNDGSHNATVKLVMSSDDDNDEEGIDADLVLAGAEAISTSLISDSPNMVAVIVFDIRKWYFAPNANNKVAYNVQIPALSISGASAATTDFQHQTLFSGTSIWSWAQMITTLEIPNLPANPTWNPRNCIWNGVPLNRIVDDIARRLFLVVGFDPSSNSNQNINFQLFFRVPGHSDDDNNSIKDSAADSLLFDTAGVKNTDLLPGTFAVNFIVIDADHPTDVYKNSFYTKSVSTGASGNKTQPIDVGDYLGYYSSGALVNQTELDTVAADLAARAKVFMQQVPSTVTYAGAWQFYCDGTIRGVRWTADEDGCTTVIRYNDEQMWSPVLDMYRRMELVSNQLVVGIGSTQVGAGPNGTRYVSVPASPGSILWGQPTALWTPGNNTLNLQPLTGYGGTNVGSPINAFIEVNQSIPAYCAFTTGSSVAYFTSGGNNYLVRNLQPAYTAQWQTRFDNAGPPNSNEVTGFIRSH